MLKKCFITLNFHSRRLISLQKTKTFDWMKQEKVIMEPFEYVHNLPCKHLAMIPPAFNYWLQVPQDKYDIIDEASRTWVTWGTLLDDIQDQSEYRQGAPAAQRFFSVGAVINSAGLTLMQAIKQMKELGHPLAQSILMKRTEMVLRAEGVDFYWRDKCVCPSEEAYVDMTRKKSGSYFALPVELMQLFSSNKTDYTDLIVDIGSYYEMLDDYYNLFHPKALRRLAMKIQENHMTNSDITEGKITLAIIHASQFPDVAIELTDILKSRTRDPKLQNRAITLMKKHGSDEYVRDKMTKLEADIRAEIDRLGGNPLLTEYMDDLCFQYHQPPPEQDLY